MFLTFITTFVVFLETTAEGVTIPWSGEFNTTKKPIIPCTDFGDIENGVVRVINEASHQIAVVKCNDNYDLDGAPNVYCINGKWEQLPRPQCSKRCYPPPYLKSGSLEIEGEKDENGLFHKGTLATYSCGEGFNLVPEESRYRVCEKGIWTGAYATCEPIQKVTNCAAPKDISNGYFVHEKSGEFDGFHVGQRLHYSCKSGYVLVGTPVQQCLEDGTWSPKIPPVCSLAIAGNLDDPSDYPCPVSPTVPHSYTTLVQGYQDETQAISGTVVQIHCFSKYKNTKAPCQPGKLQCINGRWIGSAPICVPAHDCDPPPAVSYAVFFNLNPEFRDMTFNNKYPIKSQVSYQCLPGYTLQGNEVLACSSGGCWLPLEPPTCYHAPSNNYFLEVNSVNAVLISGATGAGVLGLLLVICLITICRRRKPLTRAVPIAPPMPSMSDHASLLHHPDRLALIAYADGTQNEQASLPSYDEATRDRAPNPPSSRLHRPHWPNLGGRRSRNAANPSDMVHVTRHGSFASHTPSTRSAGDSMGSTDTVAVSEGSTNVTLDTASSYSGSQPASCRAHCGSLASFDTSSVANTEGVPLLEENELEETLGGDNVSLVVDNPSISDNASFKLSTNSADLC